VILEKIVDKKIFEVEARKKGVPLKLLEQKISKRNGPRNFLKKSPGKIQLIAELKKASPSKGIIREDFEPIALAKQCEKGGADALSILTEEHFFKGKIEYLDAVKEEVAIPILRKDFIIDEYQIIETMAYGADAVLLIAAILKQKVIERYLKVIHDFGMSALVEVHDGEELAMVLDTEARIIGINNRDLKTFKTDIENTERLIENIPKEKIMVSESGIFTRSDVKYLEGLDVDAILVGESIMACNDIPGKIKELKGDG